MSKGISTVVMLVGLGLGVLWIISLVTPGAAAAWFTWLVFVAASVLIVVGANAMWPRMHSK